MATPKKAQRFDDFREWNADHRASFTAHPRYKPGQTSAPAALLRSTVFALSSRTASPLAVLPAFDDLTAPSGTSISYKGALLTQADLRVLLGLLALVSGKQNNEAEVEIDACNFLESIGRATCSRSVHALTESLSSLRSATFTVRSPSGKVSIFGLLDRADGDERNTRKYRIKISHGLWQAAQASRTYLPMDLRIKLADGVQTALADLLFSSQGGRVEYEALAKQWHRKDAKELGKEVRAALGKLQAVGIVESWEAGRGVAHVTLCKRQLH